MIAASDVEAALRSKLQATDVEVIDISGGCGSSFEVYITSEAFNGKRPLQRHQLVNQSLSHLMSEIHALSIKRTKTPAEMEATATT
ncbi:hypothetical protein Ndes2526B_g02285 [Nannochloris sp. 'desiccata']|nr:putative Protein BOLA2 [Chlorella desiccata (nom. nud.)]